MIIDTDPWIAVFLEVLKNHVHSDQPLWVSSPEQNIHLFNDIALQLGLEPLRPTRYALRRGGASEDLLGGTRTLDSVEKCGRWRTDASLRRYSKETKLLSEIAKIPPDTVELGRRALENMPAVLAGQLNLQPP